MFPEIRLGAVPRFFFFVYDFSGAADSKGFGKLKPNGLDFLGEIVAECK